MSQFDVPILYLVFNRPDLVKLTFPSIKSQKPKKLFIASDGPRDTHTEDPARVDECRNWVLDQIDWECELKTLFREKNLGSGVAVSEAITWFFKQVEMGIILEDDILTNESFFQFQQKMLEKYALVKNVLHVSGSNFLFGKTYTPDDYYYSKFPNTWGWGTWSDRWDLFQFDLEISLEKISEFALSYHNKGIKNLWEHRLNALKNNVVDAWDYQWFFQLIINDMITVVPQKNLVTNIGIGDQATHTTVFAKKYNSVTLESLPYDLKYPSQVKYSRSSDIKHYKNIFKETTENRLRNLAYKYIPERLYTMLKLILRRSHG